MAFFVGGPAAGASLLGAALGVVAACADPARPTFPDSDDPDTTPPSISITSPPSDTMVAAGSVVTVTVHVADRSPIASLTCAVSGAVNFGFPAIAPGDTAATVAFPIPTAGGASGIVTVTVGATDIRHNGASAPFAFIVR